MGGAKSKFDACEWEKANGKLQDGDCTLDGTRPTAKYGVFILTKKAVNQREFDVTDAEQNLIYTTRAVPGTIACFDVMGKGMDDYLLRVNVDLRRRYWSVCRFNVCTFAGQKTDQEATEKLITEIDDNKTLANPLLFKKALITVSWSRYLAVAAFYGPPTAEMLMPAPSQELDDYSESSTEEDLFLEASRIAERMRTRAVEEAVSDPEEETDDDQTVTTAESKEPPVPPPETDSKDPEPRLQLHPSVSMPELGQSAPSSEPDEIPSSSSTRNVLASSVLTTSFMASATGTTANVGTWFRQQSMVIREKSQSYLSSSSHIEPKEPLEGIVNLDDKPLLLCQEIYNKLIGNHQTSLVTKEKVIELLQQDKAQHEKESPDEVVDDDEDDPFFTAELEIFKEDTDASPGDGEQESKSMEAEETATGSGVEGGGSVEEEEQPLVGYWSWDNTFRVHKMKMHLAKGSDLSLHVVLAIIANQVRYERNAIAMTV